jgi:hypothetical protein
MTTTYHDPDESPFDVLSLHSLCRDDEYGEAGWLVTFRVPADAVPAVFERWGPK